jgi:chemotaxis protein methyltransferase CheR
MKPDEFDFVSNLVKERSGLVLTKDKLYLLESRLMPVARKRGMKNLEDLVSALRMRREEALIREVTEAMTTNESFFFRDIKPFELFRQTILPQLIQNRASKKHFRIWCAAASSGQEPYSLAITLKEESSRLAGWRHEIVGTDISTEVLAKAKAGLYSQFEVQRGLPIQLLLKYFKKQDDLWQIDAALRAMVQYREFNLLHDLKALGSFDVVFCRNVLIYFDQPTKTRVLDQISRLLPDDGLLFLGGAETVLGISEKFKPVAGQRGAYCLANSKVTFAPPPAATATAAAAPTGGFRARK